MSRLLPDVGCFRVHLGRSHLVACELRGVLPWRRVTRKLRMAVSPGNRSGVWATLQAWMLDSRPVFATQAWTLGISEVRYVLIGSVSGLSDAGLRSRAAVAVFERQYREATDTQAFRTFWPGPARPAIGAFVAKSLLHDIETLARSTKIRLTRVEPSLAAVWNRFEPKLARLKGELVIVEDDRQLVLEHAGKAFERLALRSFDARAWPLDVHGQGTGSAMFSQTSPGNTRKRTALTLRNGKGFHSIDDAAYAPALCHDF